MWSSVGLENRTNIIASDEPADRRGFNSGRVGYRDDGPTIGTTMTDLIGRKRCRGVTLDQYVWIRQGLKTRDLGQVLMSGPILR